MAVVTRQLARRLIVFLWAFSRPSLRFSSALLLPMLSPLVWASPVGGAVAPSAAVQASTSAMTLPGGCGGDCGNAGLGLFGLAGLGWAERKVVA